MAPSITKLTSQLKECFSEKDFGELTTLEPLAGDASSRTYYRLRTQKDSFILMDSSKDASYDSFKLLTRYFLDNNLLVPKILHEFADNKWLLLTDFGDITYDKISKDGLENPYIGAMDSLAQLAFITPDKNYMPVFSYDLLSEQMTLFKEWYLDRYLKINITNDINKKLASLLNTFDLIFKTAPQVIVHMDYHSRNLLKVDCGSPGIIDYQDARIGPLGYDAISLWFDAYNKHPKDSIERWAKYYLDRLKEDHRYKFMSYDLLLNLCYMTGLQRLIKILGIFARLKLKYNKPNYEQYIPKVLKDILFILDLYPNMCSISDIISNQEIEKIL